MQYFSLIAATYLHPDFSFALGVTLLEMTAVNNLSLLTIYRNHVTIRV